MEEIEYFEKTQTIISEMQAECPDIIRDTTYTSKSKIPFKIGSIHATLYKRSVEIGEVSLTLYNTFKVIPAFILTRQSIETTALMYRLSKKLEESVATKEWDGLDEFIMVTMFGSRMDDATYAATNVLTAIDQLDKLVEGIREQYDTLSEYVHPNQLGVLYGYGDLDKTNYTLTIRGSHSLPRMMGLPLLLGSLKLSQLFFRKVVRFTEELNILLENES